MIVLCEPQHTLLRFDDRFYRWIAVKRFRWDGVGDDRSVLETLLGSLHYRDTYISPDSHLIDSEAVHGPYRVDRISTEAFEKLSELAARAWIDDFCALDSMTPKPEVIGQIESTILTRLHRAQSYRLGPVYNAEHDTMWILKEFREVVTISRAKREVALIVMGID